MGLHPDKRDSRRFSRIPAQIPVTLRRLAHAESGPDTMAASGQNISRGGICIISGAPYPEGAMVALEIRLMGWEKYTTPSALTDPAPQGRPLTALGQVVWCRPGPGGRKHEVGIRFVDVDEREYRALMVYLKNLEESQYA